MKHLFVKQNLLVSVFVHKCLMVLNDVEYTTFKMFVTQMSNYLFVISFHSQALKSHTVSKKLEHTEMACLLSWMSGKETSAKKLYFHKEKD